MNPWRLTTSQARDALDIVDGTGPFEGQGPHYSRLTPGSSKLTGPGREVILVTGGGSAAALWAVTLQRPPKGEGLVWRNSVFRNLGAGLSSELIVAATRATYAEWRRKYGALPEVPLRTEIDTRKVKSRNPGYCYLLAGWTKVPGPPSAKRRRPYMIYLNAPSADVLEAT